MSQIQELSNIQEFDILKNQILKGVTHANNFKIVVLEKLLNSVNMTETKENLARQLSLKNPDKPHPYFMEHNTVFDVLSNRLGLIQRVEKSFKIKGKFSPKQIKELRQCCKIRMGGFEN